MYTPYDYSIDITPMLNILGPIDSVHTPSTTPIRDKFTTKKLQPTGNGLLILHKNSKITKSSISPHYILLFTQTKDKAHAFYNILSHSMNTSCDVDVNVAALHLHGTRFCIRLNMIWYVYRIDMNTKEIIETKGRFDTVDELRTYLFCTV